MSYVWAEALESVIKHPWSIFLQPVSKLAIRNKPARSYYTNNQESLISLYVF